MGFIKSVRNSIDNRKKAKLDELKELLDAVCAQRLKFRNKFGGIYNDQQYKFDILSINYKFEEPLNKIKGEIEKYDADKKYNLNITKLTKKVRETQRGIEKLEETLNREIQRIKIITEADGSDQNTSAAINSIINDKIDNVNDAKTLEELVNNTFKDIFGKNGVLDMIQQHESNKAAKNRSNDFITSLKVLKSNYKKFKTSSMIVNLSGDSDSSKTLAENYGKKLTEIISKYNLEESIQNHRDYGSLISRFPSLKSLRSGFSSLVKALTPKKTSFNQGKQPVINAGAGTSESLSPVTSLVDIIFNALEVKSERAKSKDLKDKITRAQNQLKKIKKDVISELKRLNKKYKEFGNSTAEGIKLLKQFGAEINSAKEKLPPGLYKGENADFSNAEKLFTTIVEKIDKVVGSAESIQNSSFST